MKKATLILIVASVVMVGAFIVPIQIQAAPAQELDFFVQDYMIYEAKNDIVYAGNIIQIRDHQFTHVILNGYIGDSPIYGILNTTLKTSHNLVTNVVIANGISTFYITCDCVGKSSKSGQATATVTLGKPATI